MPVDNTFWSVLRGRGWDLHFLRSQNVVALNRLLRVELDNGAQYFADDGALSGIATITFQPSYAGFADSPHGFTFNTTTGAIVWANPSVPVTVPNFVVTARVTDVQTSNVYSTQIRIHIHDAIANLWCTPTPMHVRMDTTTDALANGPRFTILAEFNDGVVGNLSLSSEFIGLIPGGPSNHSWSSSNAINVTIDSVSGRLKSNVATGFSDISLTLSSIYGGGTYTDIARVNTLPAWDAPSDIGAVPAVATLVTSVGRGPGAAALNDVPNALFLSDGFTDRTAFERVVTQILSSVTARRAFFPLSRSLSKMNLWTAYLPSPQEGGTVLNPVRTFGARDSQDRRQAIEALPIPEAPTGAITNLSHLFFRVGLPLISDRNVTFSSKTSDWDLLYGPAQYSGLLEPLFDEWKLAWDYALCFDHDTALGLGSGIGPAVGDRDDDGRRVYLHPLRWSRYHLDQFIGELTDGQTAIGSTWTTGKDRRFVFVVSAGTRSGGARGSDLIVVSVETSAEIFVDASTLRPVTTTSFPVLNYLMPTIYSTFVHEMGHAVKLGDEYSGPVTLPTPPPAYLTSYLNLQVAATAMTGGSLDGTKINWNWPRAARADALVSQPTPTGAANRYTLEIPSQTNLPNTQTKFVVNEVVRLRKRPLVAMPAFPFGGSPPTDFVSDSLTIRKVTPGATSDVLEIEGTLVPADWPAKTLVFIPSVHPTTGAELYMVPESVRLHMHQGTPLDRTGAACVPDEKRVVWPKNLPAGIPDSKNRPPYTPWVMGFYEGGDQIYGCGLFRPAGTCMMRAQQLFLDDIKTGWKKPAKQVWVYSWFCPVCRYISVDILDPRLHEDDEEWYQRIYPLA